MRTLLVALLTLGLALPAFAQADISEELDVAPGALLEIQLKSGGSIDIRGWDEAHASVEVRFEDCDPDDFGFDISKRGDGVRIASHKRRGVNQSNIYVDVRVPREFDLKLSTAGGSISIQDIEGRIRGNTAGGSLDLYRLKGDIDLSTAGGTIAIEDSQLDGEVTTGGGSVLVENVEGDIDARSGGGEVVYKNVRTPTRDYSGDLVYIRNAGGAIRVDDAPAGADVQTGGGEIRIRDAQAHVRAVTGGGDIVVDRVAGSVEATTGAGDIEITVVRGSEPQDYDVALRTGSGDVVLTLPPDLSIDVDVELAFTRDRRGRCRIESDFEIAQDTSATWDDDHGTPRKYIYGTARLNGGEHRIEIRTVNGDVILRRGDRR